MGIFDSLKKRQRGTQSDIDIVNEFTKKWEPIIKKASVSKTPELESLLNQYEEEANELKAKLDERNLKIMQEQLDKVRRMKDEATREWQRVTRETEDEINYLEGRLKEVSNLPGNKKANDVVHKEADIFLDKIREIAEKEFDEKYGKYFEQIKLYIHKKKFKVFLEVGDDPDKSLNSMFLLAKEQAKKEYNFDSDLDEKDLLLPFLIEKKYMGIISQEEEKELNDAYVRCKEDSNELLWHINISIVILSRAIDINLSDQLLPSYQKYRKEKLERKNHTYHYNGNPREYTGSHSDGIRSKK